MKSAMMGIDPGVSGGIAVLEEDGSVVLTTALHPAMTEQDVADAVRHAVRQLGVLGGLQCYFEKVGYKRGDGGKGAFTFGRIDGLLRGALRALGGMTVIDVYPQRWQARMNCLTRGNKNVSKRRAQELFPGTKITHAIADALLIARYGQLRLVERAHDPLAL